MGSDDRDSVANDGSGFTLLKKSVNLFLSRNIMHPSYDSTPSIGIDEKELPLTFWLRLTCKV